MAYNRAYYLKSRCKAKKESLCPYCKNKKNSLMTFCSIDCEISFLYSSLDKDILKKIKLKEYSVIDILDLFEIEPIPQLIKLREQRLKIKYNTKYMKVYDIFKEINQDLSDTQLKTLADEYIISSKTLNFTISKSAEFIERYKMAKIALYEITK